MMMMVLLLFYKVHSVSNQIESEAWDVMLENIEHKKLSRKVVEVLQDFLSENVDKKFTTDYNVS